MTFSRIFEARQFPIFQNVPFSSEQEARACTKGDVVLVQDHDTGLVFNAAFQPELMQYDRSYQNEQGLSAFFRTHLAEVAEILTRHFESGKTIEIGCGKGHFLEYMQSRGFRLFGVDPIYEGANPSIFKEVFTPAMGRGYGGFILRHVLEHIANPMMFLRQLIGGNTTTTKIYIEVPCFEWICLRRAWYDIFYEHVNYFCMEDFRRMFGTIYESGYLFNKQYMYVVADISTLRTPRLEKLAESRFPSDFLSSVNSFSKSITEDNKRGKPSIVWGAASKGVIFSIYMERFGSKVDYAIDINPAKSEKFLPGSGIKVSLPDVVLPRLDDGSTIYVMNENYLDEIRKMSGNRFNYCVV